MRGRRVTSCTRPRRQDRRPLGTSRSCTGRAQHAPRRASVAPALPAPFPRDLRAACERPRTGSDPVLCSPFRALPGPRRTPRSTTVPPREEDVRAPVTDDEHPSCWRRIRAELQRAVPESTWHQWLEPLTGHQRRGRDARRRGARARSGRGSPQRFGAARSQALRPAAVARGADVERSSSSVAAASGPTRSADGATGRHGHAPAATRAAGARASASGRFNPPAPHVRAVRHRRLQPARPRGRARRRRAARASPTTRSSSAARPGSARPTSCTRSPTT